MGAERPRVPAHDPRGLSGCVENGLSRSRRRPFGLRALAARLGVLLGCSEPPNSVVMAAWRAWASCSISSDTALARWVSSGFERLASRWTSRACRISSVSDVPDSCAEHAELGVQLVVQTDGQGLHDLTPF